MPLAARGHFFLGRGLRLQLGDILPARVLGGRGAAIRVAFLDFQERFLAQRGQENAHFALHLGLSQAILQLVLDFLESRLPCFVPLVHFQDQERIRPPDRIRDEALLRVEHQIFDRLIHQAFAHGSNLTAVFGGLDVIGVVARQFVELLALLGARRQILGFLLRHRDLFRSLSFEWRSRSG